MPIRITKLVTPGTGYNSPFVGPAEHPVMIPVSVAALTAAEVDANGFIKPGVPLSSAGVLVGAGEAVFGICPEAVKIATSNSSADMTAAGTIDMTVIVIGAVNYHIIEANLGRALTADEKAGFGLAGSTIKMLG